MAIGMAGMSAGPAPRSLEDDLIEQLKTLLPHMAPQERAEATRELYEGLQRKHAMRSGPPQLTTPQRMSAVSSQLTDPWVSQSEPQTIADYARQFSEAGEAVHEVLGYLAAQMNMDIFAGKPKAKTLFERIIQAGLATTFHYRNYP